MSATLPNFRQRITARSRPPADHEIVIDGFAGFGGWGLGEEHANGYAIDVAFNHDPLACSAYQVNHPATHVLRSDAFEVHPLSVEPGRPIAHCHFSPDCTHYSKAHGAAPVSDRVRGLAWVVLAWAYHRRPRVITLENVEEFQDWGPTRAVAGRGRVPIRDRAGETFRAFIGALSDGSNRRAAATREIGECIGSTAPVAEIVKGLGYKVQWRELRACDYGAPTIRKRFFLVARSDGQAIVWPEPTHSAETYRTAAECIDWSIPCPSIFMSAAEAQAYYEATGQRIIRPLKPNTLKRIANGVRRFVLESAQPFIVSVNHGDAGGRREYPLDEPMRTICSQRRGEALVAPLLVGAGGTTGTGRPRRADRPLKTIKREDRQAVVAAFMARHFGGMSARDLRKPAPTFTARATQNQLAAVHLMHQYTSNTNGGNGNMREPLKTIVAGGNHAALIATFLQVYYGSGSGKTGRGLRDPLPTITAEDRFGLVTVSIGGEPYVIIDIGMRMLQPHELLRAQFGEFADSWVLHGTKTQQLAGIGNSVCPHVARAIVKANVTIRRAGPADREAAA